MGSYGLPGLSESKNVRFPSSVGLAATKDQLGSCTDHYHFSAFILLKRMGIGLSGMVMGGLLRLLAYNIKDIGVHRLGDAIVLGGVILLALALLIFGFWFIISSLIALILVRQQIYLFERGLVTLGVAR